MKSVLCFLILISGFLTARPQSRELAAIAMRINASHVNAPTGTQSMLLKGIEDEWLNTADGRYFRNLQQSLDSLISKNGTISGYDPSHTSMADIDKGAALVLLYKVTEIEKYWKAATTLYQELQKGLASESSSLNGHELYAAMPFYAAYAVTAHNDGALGDIASRFTALEKAVRDPASGLLFYKNPGKPSASAISAVCMKNWRQNMGLFGMALIDVLEDIPSQHSAHATLADMLIRYAGAVSKMHASPDAKAGDPLADAMFAYVLAKGAGLDVLPSKYEALARERYNGVMKQLHADMEKTFLAVNGRKEAIGDPFAIGVLLQTVNEMEMEATRSAGRGKTVLLDNFFNHEVKTDITGRTADWHYKWNEWSNGGFSLLGHAFRKYGIKTAQLNEEPTAAHLKGAGIFIIVDPDTKKEAEQPNYVLPQHIDALYNWVKAGGVLVLMGNDTGNAEFEHFNQLADRFGIHFNEDSRNRVPGNQYEVGAFYLRNNELLTTTRKIYMKEISTLKLNSPARSVLTDRGDAILAVSKLGKGTVFAVGDPWLYNEYTDGRKLPVDYENYQAAKDLVRWLVRQCPPKN